MLKAALAVGSALGVSRYGPEQLDFLRYRPVLLNTALKERFGSEGRVRELDGLSVDADDWHFNVRPSNTEPLLRLNLEARSQELMERKRDEVLAVIRS